MRAGDAAGSFAKVFEGLGRGVFGAQLMQGTLNCRRLSALKRFSVRRRLMLLPAFMLGLTSRALLSGSRLTVAHWCKLTQSARIMKRDG